MTESTLDWRAMFMRYIHIVSRAEGVAFLDPEDWSAEEWAAINDGASDD